MARELYPDGPAPGCLPGMALRNRDVAMFRRAAARATVVMALGSLLISACSSVASSDVLYPTNVQKILTTYCYDCHGDGMNKGKVAFDQFTSHNEVLTNRDLFFNALKNVRAGIMPPQKKPRPDAQEQQELAEWIKTGVFQIDEQNPDPGRVTLRRLNRVEYHNTIRDLTGYDFKVDDELPPDDTGYGFDTIGDVLTLSPLLLEKYMSAAELITREAVPRLPRVAPEKTLDGAEFHGTGDADHISFYEPAELSHTFKTELPGKVPAQARLGGARSIRVRSGSLSRRFEIRRPTSVDQRVRLAER